MSIFEIILIGIGLSMDACAVSMTNGMCDSKLKLNKSLLMAFMFGLFQGAMPLIGYFAGSAFSSKISAVDHWIALVLLGFIGGKMIYDGFFEKNDEEEKESYITLKLLFAQAVATSIDALAVGVSFAAMNVNVYFAVSVIAVTTFILSLVAVFIGKKIGDRINNLAQIFGGSILVLIGLKIFIEHMFF